MHLLYEAAWVDNVLFPPTLPQLTPTNRYYTRHAGCARLNADMIRLVFILLLVSSNEIAHGKYRYNNNISCLQYGIVSGLTGLPGRPCPC